MSYLEEKEIFLESTSSMVFDRVNRIVYAGISPRTNPVQLILWCRKNDYELILFETESHIGSPIYHTDVLMYVGTNLIGGERGLVSYFEKKKIQNELVKKEKELNLEINSLKKKIILITNNDLDFLDMLYREKLKYGTKEEIIIRIR